MSGIKIYNVGLNGVQLSKGITVQEFKSWIVGTLGGTGSDVFYSVIQSHDGGYIAVGNQQSDSQGYQDGWIVKYDSNLNLVTQKSLGGTNTDIFYSVIQSNDGGYIAVGYQQSDSQGDNDAWIVKYDSNLNLLTQKSLGGSGTDRYMSVIQSHDGGYVAVGYQPSDSQGGNDGWIVKYDSNLNLVTQKSLGGTGNDYYQSVIQSPDGGYIAVGYQNSDAQGGNDAWIVKYDSNLNLVTQKSLGGTNTDLYQSVIQSHDGGYVAVGYQQSASQGGYDAFIVKYDSNLDVLAQRSLGGTSHEFYQSVIQSHDGGYIAVGYQASDSQGNSDGWIVKYDSNLNLVTQKSLGGSGADYYRSIIQSHDGGYVVVGHQNSDSQGSHDGLITKLPSDFALLDGSLSNHTGLVWTTPVLTETIPALTVSIPALTVTIPALAASTPVLTVSTPLLVETRSEKQ